MNAVVIPDVELDDPTRFISRSETYTRISDLCRAEQILVQLERNKAVGRN